LSSWLIVLALLIWYKNCANLISLLKKEEQIWMNHFHFLFSDSLFSGMQTLDWIIIALFFLFFLALGIYVGRGSGKNAKDYFLSGRNLPWWVLGISMVATTFSADTPNLVTDIVRKNGVSGNWVWWAFLITGMVTVFIYARFWRRSEVLTDLAFYELRYSGKAAAFLRAFRALYLGLFFNVVIMATVSLAAIKIGGIMFGFKPWETVVYASIITVLYSSFGGLRSVVITDLVQFLAAMVGSIAAAVYLVRLPEVGGLDSLLSFEVVQQKMDYFPDFGNPEIWVPLLLIPIAVQWWSVWYPGAEPGGGGYVAQRMLASKSEGHSIFATFLFNITHYALRPWPWILIALASLVVFPDLDSIAASFPGIDPSIVNDDLAYPAMLSRLPAGLLGLVAASLVAAFMSTISTHLNWGSSYLTLDFQKRFLQPDLAEDKLVWMGRIWTLILMVLSAFLALAMESALDSFRILLQIGAGTGSIYLLRWFWWRVNAWSEISGMIISFVLALVLEVWKPGVIAEWSGTVKLLVGVGTTTMGWILITLMTPPEDESVLRAFVQKVRPYGMAWKPYAMEGEEDNAKESFGKDILKIFLGISIVYGLLFGLGALIYGWQLQAWIFLGLFSISFIWMWRIWKDPS
jgi:Na+/proline symporter